jgi:hypothetical protein
MAVRVAPLAHQPTLPIAGVDAMRNLAHMGLGDGGWTDIEWFSLDDVADDPAGDALLAWFTEHPLWADDDTERVLLVDLDNVRAAATRLKARLAVTVALARDSHYAAFAGQPAAVERSRPLLAVFGAGALAVGGGADEADWALLDAAEAAVARADGQRLQFIVVSNDNIFARLAGRGRLRVVSPGGQALSDQLRDAADQVVDLAELERTVAH